MNRWTRASVLLLLLLGCGSLREGESKSVYELDEADFAEHRDELASTAAPPCSGQSCLQFEKGDVLLFKATGTLQTRLGPVGPNGSDSWGGISYALVNRPAFGLFAKINQSVFLIGEETVMIAPDTGRLEILINGCSSSPGSIIDCSTTGSFNVTVHSKLKPGVTISTNPALTDNSVLSRTLATVNSGGTWQDSGVAVRKGQKIYVSATGTFSADRFGQPAVLNADGEPDGANGGSSFQLLNRFAYRLYGRVNHSVIELGTEAAFLAPAAGPLELIVNHRNDTSGTIQVTVGQGVVPARGLLHADAAAFSQLGTFSVPSSGLWSPSTLSVQKGDPILSSATGAISGTSVNGGAVGPFGEGTVGGSPYVLTNRPRFALFGRVRSQVFFLGGENAVLAPAAGTVELVSNNAPSCPTCQSCDAGPECIPCSYCDATGSFAVTLKAP